MFERASETRGRDWRHLFDLTKNSRHGLLNLLDYLNVINIQGIRDQFRDAWYDAFAKIVEQATLLSTIAITTEPQDLKLPLVFRRRLADLLCFPNLLHLKRTILSGSLFVNERHLILSIVQKRSERINMVQIEGIDLSNYSVLDLGWDDILFQLRQAECKQLQRFELTTIDGLPFLYADAALYLRKETEMSPWPAAAITSPGYLTFAENDLLITP